MAKVAHKTARDRKIKTSFGEFDVDAEGPFDVPEDVAAQMCDGRYGTIFTDLLVDGEAAPPKRRKKRPAATNKVASSKSAARKKKVVRRRRAE